VGSIFLSMVPDRWQTKVRRYTMAKHRVAVLVTFAACLCFTLHEVSRTVFVAPHFPTMLTRSSQMNNVVTLAASGAQFLNEVQSLAVTADEAELNSYVDVNFARLKSEDMNVLQMLVGSDDEAVKAKWTPVMVAVQASMERRMDAARSDINDLMMSSGNIDENIVKCLAKQDNPLPILAVLSLNVARASKGSNKQYQALTYILNAMNAELEKKVPLVKKVISRLISTEDQGARQGLLQGVLEAQEGIKVGDLASELLQLVEDAEARFSDPATAPQKEATLELIKGVSFDAGVVIGEVFGDDEQEDFSEQMMPLFIALGGD